MIRASEVSVRLGGRQVLSDVSLSVGAGEWLAVLGPNGSGKTTLLRALLGYLRHSGSVGAPANIAYVPQRPEIPAGMTVVEYVSLGRARLEGWGRESERGRSLISQVLDRLELGAMAGRFVTDLSGGEMQRAAVARAIVQEPQVLLLDEPTSALDPQHRVSLLQEVDRLRAQGVAVISAMHDITLAAKFADSALLLNAGTTALAGETTQVICDPAFVETFGGGFKIAFVDGLPVSLPLK